VTDPVHNVLFLCTGNSARSIIAEALLNHYGKGRFKAYSAGSHPCGVVNPLALQVLARSGIPAGNARSKSWDEFASPDAPVMHFVFTVCDNAAHEVCPVWPGRPITAHWGVPDPALAAGTPEQRYRVFADTLTVLKRRLDIFVNLPIATLSRLSLKKEVDAIGRR